MRLFVKERAKVEAEASWEARGKYIKEEQQENIATIYIYIYTI